VPATVRVVLKPEGVRQLLKGPEIAARLVAMGRSIAEGAGAGIVVKLDRGPNRNRVEVVTDTFEAMRREAKHRTLTGALDRGRR
jgi:hypothetical protein